MDPYKFLKKVWLPLVLLCEAAVAMMSCSEALVSSGGGGGVSSVRGGMAAGDNDLIDWFIIEEVRLDGLE